MGKYISGRNNNTIQVFWVSLGSLSSFALALVSTAILSRYFEKTEYGTYRQILYVYNTLLIVFTAGLPKVFNYFLPRFNLSAGKDIVWKISKTLFVGGIIFSVFLFFFSGLIADVLKNPELSRGLKYFSPIPMLLLPTLGIEGIFSTYKKTIYIAIYNAISRTIMLLFIVLPVIVLKGTYIYAIYGWIISSFILLIVAYFFKSIPFKGVENEKSNLKFKEIFNYSLPLVAAALGGIIFRASNQFYISRNFGSEVFAEFSNGFIEIPFVHMITGATATVLMPIFSKIVHDKSDLSQITKLWRTTLQRSAVLIYPLVVFFLFYSEEVITIIYSDAYAVSAKYFSVVIIINFFNIIIFAPLLLSLGEGKFYAKLEYGKAITIWVVQYFTIKIFNTPMAVAISFMLVSVCAVFIPLMYIAKIFNVSLISLFPLGRFFVIAVHSFVSLFVVNLFVARFFYGNSDIVYLAISGVAYAGVLILSAKWVNINYWEIVLPLLKRNKK